MENSDKIQQDIETKILNVVFKSKEEFENEFDLAEKQEISTKGQCVTYKMTSKINKKTYGVKYVELAKDKDLTDEQKSQLKLAKLVRHTNVVKYHDIFNWSDDSKVYYIITQDFTDKHLGNLIDGLASTKKKFTDIHLLWILKQNVDMLTYLLENFNAHNLALCPENITTLGDDVWKMQGHDHSLDAIFDLEPIENNKYAAPEYKEALAKGDISQVDLTKADIFSLGIVFTRCAGILTEKDITDLNKNSEQETVDKVKKIIKSPKIAAGGQKKWQATMIELMIQIDPTARIDLTSLRNKLNCCTIRQELQK